MEDLKTDWETIQGILQGIDGFDPRAVKRYHEVGPAKAGIHFFLIRYVPGEVIVAKGTTTDYAAVHVQGVVKARDVVPPSRTSGQGCWEHPQRHRLESLVLQHAEEKGNTPRRGLLGWLTRPLATLYWSLPGLPLCVLDFCNDHASPTLTDRWKDHLTRVLHGRFSHVRRAERELSHPGKSNSNDGTSTGPSLGERSLTIRDTAGKLMPVEQRFLGMASTLWNQVRSTTLVAGNDADDGDKPCVLLLIKRKALEEIVKKSPRFYERQMIEFLDKTLPDILARNRLFRDRLFVDDVRDWPTLVAALQGHVARSSLDGLRRCLDPKFAGWLRTVDGERLEGADKSYLVEQINQALSNRELPSSVPAPLPVGEEGKKLLARIRASLNECESFRLNRLLVEAALPGVFQASPTPFPLSREDFQAFTRAISRMHYHKFGTVLKPDRLENRDRKKGPKGTVVFKQGDPADSLYLILTGMVRVSMNLSGGHTMVNNLEADAYFGESAVLDGASASDVPLRSANVETLCSSTLLRLDRDILRALFAGEYRVLGEKLKRERQSFSCRDEDMRTGRLLPPAEPPLEIAQRLVLTRNVLLIDMDQCTRCDQCVRGCAEVHDRQPRFHRANPDLRFGKWEVAGACLHCLDSPCQQVCPVGAITLLEDMAVQIHRDRCIGCSLCAVECPFDVVDMYAPTSPLDAPSSKKGIVANKCDLCLTDEHDPPCVASCPYDAARRVDPVEFFADLKGWANFAGRQ